ncbi:hypothetical protein LRAMOSA01685 [Lichtheimia ramosa]|uniref:Uncharacterized protein n=1 Tax=Lichtheimia ramosa TaxID=688394 RepID=A0A077WIW3_9FUNG|nr:hypothetical protein LRAMOSA01685 [Lichtheimia ramosa]
MSKFLYGALLWVRWIASSTPGYVHPDEYFQSPEITANAILNIDSYIPWEFEKENAIRAVIPPIAILGYEDCITAKYSIS